MKLRDYQNQAVDAARSDLARNQSTLVVMATGLGKTVVMIDMIRRCLSSGTRAMLVAHRTELIQQPEARIMQTLGVVPAIEKAESKAGSKASIVLASIQTLTSEILGHRQYNKFDPNDYSLLLVDEAHRHQ